MWRELYRCAVTLNVYNGDAPLAGGDVDLTCSDADNTHIVGIQSSKCILFTFLYLSVRMKCCLLNADSGVNEKIGGEGGGGRRGSCWLI